MTFKMIKIFHFGEKMEYFVDVFQFFPVKHWKKFNTTQQISATT